LLPDCKNLLGESVIWDPKREQLLWVNIHDGELWRHRSASSIVRVHRMPERLGCIGLRQGGGLVVGLASGHGLYNLDTEVLERLAEVEPDLPTTWLNDGRIYRQGRFVWGMAEGEPQVPLSAGNQPDLPQLRRPGPRDAVRYLGSLRVSDREASLDAGGAAP